MKAVASKKSASPSTTAARPFFQAKPEHAALDSAVAESKQPTFFRPLRSDAAGTPPIQLKHSESELQTPEHRAKQEGAEQIDVQRTPAFESPDDSPDSSALVQRRPAPESDRPTAGFGLQAQFARDRTPFFQPARQRQAISGVGAIAPQPAPPQTQPVAETEELDKQDREESIAKTPQLQMIPAFSRADTSDDGEEDNAERSPVQFRLIIGQPRDFYEREADTMADRVAARSRALSREGAAADAKTLTPAQPQRVSRKPESLMKPSDATVDWLAALKKGAWGKAGKTLTPSRPRRVSRKPASRMTQSNDKPSIAPEPLESRLQQAKGRGAPLDADTRTEMEDAFSSDFSGVQIHTGQEAASLNQSLNARAFTHGNNIFFNQGEYQPQSEQGKHLLAHELTHTIQQGHGVQQKVGEYPSIQAGQPTPGLQRAPDGPGNEATVSSEVVDISSGSFKPSEKVKGEIEAKGRKGLDVRTKIEGVTSEGRVKVKLDRKGNYTSIGKGAMPLRNAWAKQLGGMYVNYWVKDNKITGGYASLTAKGRNTNDWLKALKKNSAALGGLGLKVGSLPTPVNKLEGGKLTLGVNDLDVEVGGFVDAQFNFLLENASKPKIDATANINVKGIASGVLKLDNTQEKLTGEVGLGVNLKGFIGEAKVQYKKDGTVDIGGKAGYNANKLSGEIEFVATDLETANRFGRDAIKAAGGKEKVQDAPPPAPVPAAKKGSKRRALAATGQLGFNLTTWFAGTVNVVVDGKGDITVIGRINPPAEIELFKQRNWEKEIIKFEARAYYGIPLVGNLNVFANIGLYALAKLGPAKIYNIEVLGTYSTDPDIQRNIQISGSLNISAYAGLRLRAEGGAGIELLAHDVRFGIGLNADVGVKAYADARPTIGYRDPGVFYISGTLEMVAMPMLGLGGDFFIELDSPWFSPAPDKKWVWPLFSKEWPLTDPIGLNAVVKDYELGSGKVPEVEFKKPEFDPSKFMTNMVDNKLPNKSGGKAKGQGTFKEDGSVPKPDVKPKKPAPAQKGTKPSKKGTPPPLGKSAKPDPKAAKAEKSMKLLVDATKKTAALKAKAPFTQPDLNKELTKIKGQVRGVDFSVKPKDEMWTITPKAGGKAGRPFKLGKKGDDDKAKDSMKLLVDAAKRMAALKAKAPFAKADLNKGLTKIKGQVRGVDFSVKPKDKKWAITPKAGGKTGKRFELGAKDAMGPEKATYARKEKHEQYIKEIKRSLEQKPKKEIESFKKFYGWMKKRADALENSYNKKLQKGVKARISIPPLSADQKDNDVDFEITIAPNASRGKGSNKNISKKTILKRILEYQSAKDKDKKYNDTLLVPRDLQVIYRKYRDKYIEAQETITSITGGEFGDGTSAFMAMLEEYAGGAGTDKPPVSLKKGTFHKEKIKDLIKPLEKYHGWIQKGDLFGDEETRIREYSKEKIKKHLK